MAQSQTIWQALVAAKSKFETVGTTGYNSHLKSHYAKLGDIHKAINRPLLDNGLFVTSYPLDTENGLVVECVIVHAETGETIAQRCPLFVGKQDMQGLGSAISYARRYLLLSMLDLDMDGIDDDGEEASQPQRTQNARSQPRQAQTPPQPAKRQEPADYALEQANGNGAQLDDNPFEDDDNASERLHKQFVIEAGNTFGGHDEEAARHWFVTKWTTHFTETIRESSTELTDDEKREAIAYLKKNRANIRKSFEAYETQPATEPA